MSAIVSAVTVIEVSCCDFASASFFLYLSSALFLSQILAQNTSFCNNTYISKQIGMSYVYVLASS